MDDRELIETLAAVVWGMNLDRDAHSIARDLVPVVRSVAPLVAPLGAPPLYLAQHHPHPLSVQWWDELREAWTQDRAAS